MLQKYKEKNTITEIENEIKANLNNIDIINSYRKNNKNHDLLTTPLRQNLLGSKNFSSTDLATVYKGLQTFLYSAEKDHEEAKRMSREINRDATTTKNPQHSDYVFGGAFLIMVLADPAIGNEHLVVTGAGNGINIAKTYICHYQHPQVAEKMMNLAAAKIDFISNVLTILNSCYLEKRKLDEKNDDRGAFSSIFNGMSDVLLRGGNLMNETKRARKLITQGVLASLFLIIVVAVLFKIFENTEINNLLADMMSDFNSDSLDKTNAPLPQNNFPSPG